MLNANIPGAPQLDAHGKGLPKFELFIARIMVGWKARRTTRLEAAAQFEYEKIEVLKILRGTDPTDGGRQMLIKRLRGLEDSSRFWSIYMTADHLRIVNDRMGEAIRYLIGGVPPAQVVGTADVAGGTTRRGQGPAPTDDGIGRSDRLSRHADPGRQARWFECRRVRRQLQRTPQHHRLAGRRGPGRDLA